MGWYCGVASALARLGIRGHSGPFDWIFSDYSSVLYQIEHNFQDYLNIENLKVCDENEMFFKDLKYGFVYPHDIQMNFENEYHVIFEKYMRRVNFFLNRLFIQLFF